MSTEEARLPMQAFVEYLREDHGPRIAACGQEVLKETPVFDSYDDLLKAAYCRFDRQHQREVWKAATTAVRT